MNGIRSSGLVLAWILLAFVPTEPSTTAATSVDSTMATVEAQVTGVHRLTSIEATPADDGVRVFLAADGPIKARPRVLSNPDRLVLDLEGVRSALPMHRIPVDSAAVKGVRVGQHQEGRVPVARVVLDLRGRSLIPSEPARRPRRDDRRTCRNCRHGGRRHGEAGRRRPRCRPPSSPRRAKPGLLLRRATSFRSAVRPPRRQHRRPWRARSPRCRARRTLPRPRRTRRPASLPRRTSRAVCPG